MYKRLLTVLLVFSLLGFFSCGESDEVDNPTPPQEQPSNPDGGEDDGEDGGENDGEEDGSESVDPLPDNIELGENTVQLSKAQKDNIESVDEGNTTLSFSLSTPEDQIPEVGQIILQLEPTESLPFGFLGRVTNVANNGTAIVVETEAPALIEAFDKLEFDEELKILQDPTRFSWGTDEYGYHYFTFDAKTEVELRPGVVLGLSGDITFSSKTTSKGEFNRYLNKEDLDFDIKTKIAAQNLALKLAGKINNSGSNFMKIPVGPAIPFTGLLGKLSVEAALQLYAGGKLSGEAGLQIGFSHESAKSFQIKSEQGKWINMQPSSDDDAELSTPEGEATFSPEVSFYLEGSAMLGFFTGFELRLFGRDEYKLSLAPYAGYEISSNQNLINFADLEYEESKDVHVTGAVVAGVEASANATFFNHKVDATIFNVNWRGAELHRYIFPTFDGSYEVNDANRADCEVVVERDVLIPMEVGVGQYYGENLVEYSQPLPYHLNKSFPNPYTANFSHEGGYSYYSYVKWLDRYIRCSKLQNDEEDELRELLEKFYHDTGGDHWYCDDNWCTDAPLAEWYGIISDGEYYYLYLDSNNLVGSGSLAGCPYLLGLSFNHNQITSLDVSGCTSLRYLECNSNPLTNVDITDCTSLVKLSCMDCQLTHLDVSICNELLNLVCPRNQLTSNLDLSNCKKLIYVDCSSNQLSSIDASNCSMLDNLACRVNQLANLDVSGCTALTGLDCADNQLTSLNVSGCTALTYFDCSHNQLASLDVSGCTALEILNCSYNQFASLDVSGCTALKDLFCYNDQLTSLDVSGCTALIKLDVDEYELTSLDASGCTALETLWCFDNQLTSLDVSGCTALKDLRCFNNKINQVITDFYDRISEFIYDQRYTGYWWEDIYNSEGVYIGQILHYTDNGVGWWYPGEPQKGYHGK